MFYVYLQEFNSQRRLLANVKIATEKTEEEALDAVLCYQAAEPEPEGIVYQFMLLHVAGPGQARVAFVGGEGVQYANNAN
jgi:hypothetical protein